MTEGLKRLTEELERWDAAGLRPQFWLRDDDAVRDTPELRRLVDACRPSAVPLSLAVIPNGAEQCLQNAFEDVFGPQISLLVHGFAHENHEPEGIKKCELGPSRPLATVAGEVALGKARLEQLFGARVLPVLVPPWNRMRPDLAPLLSELGFVGLSTFGAQCFGAGGLVEVNTHVDLMDWRSRKGKTADAVAEEIAQLLATRRIGSARGPVGVLAHHLVHDDAAWEALAAVFAATMGRGAWLRGEAVFGGEALVEGGPGSALRFGRDDGGPSRRSLAAAPQDEGFGGGGPSAGGRVGGAGFRQPWGVTVVAVLKALAGLAVTGAVALGGLGNPWVLAIAGIIALLFGAQLIAAVARHMSVIGIDDDAITRSTPFGRQIRWADLDDVELRYFSTRRDRENGWMDLVLRGGRQKIVIDSDHPGFDPAVRRAVRTLRKKGIAMSPATIANAIVLGLDVGPTGR
ncbi:hypothetical protein FHS85_004765 [Rhodoligotrophos appendicifer]|uniref:polysaccharide deacetylase family protein n=1 Tax=Rhodoligotrophos appendicifer TaxID=987056 RepID=UPI00195FB9F2|nr:polysaccharide deacetylase family protein [Rhodoligotrophos appendicifer]